MIKWDQVRGEFNKDGSLRDIYVLNTDLDHWQKLLDALHSSPFRVRYFHGGVESQTPVDAAKLFPEPGFCDRLLRIDLLGPVFQSHFFTKKEIEFDLEPNEVNSQSDLDEVFQFMDLIARATGREVILTPENSENAAIFRVRSGNTNVVYCPTCVFDERQI